MTSYHFLLCCNFVSPFSSAFIFPSKQKVTNILISLLILVLPFSQRAWRGLIQNAQNYVHRQTQYEVTAFRSKNDCFALVTFKNVKHHSLSLFKVINSLYLNSSRPPEAGGRFLWFKTPDRPPWIQVFLLSDILIRTVDIHPKIHR